MQLMIVHKQPSHGHTQSRMLMHSHIQLAVCTNGEFQTWHVPLSIDSWVLGSWMAMLACWVLRGQEWASPLPRQSYVLTLSHSELGNRELFALRSAVAQINRGRVRCDCMMGGMSFVQTFRDLYILNVKIVVHRVHVAVRVSYGAVSHACRSCESCMPSMEGHHLDI